MGLEFVAKWPSYYYAKDKWPLNGEVTYMGEDSNCSEARDFRASLLHCHPSSFPPNLVHLRGGVTEGTKKIQTKCPCIFSLWWRRKSEGFGKFPPIVSRTERNKHIDGKTWPKLTDTQAWVCARAHIQSHMQPSSGLLFFLSSHRQILGTHTARSLWVGVLEDMFETDINS